VPVTTTAARAPLAALRARVQELRQHLRQRLRARDSRMGIDPQTPEHVADAADQQIEQAVERVATAITTAQDETDAVNPGTKEAVVAELQQATQAVEQAAIAPPAPQSGTDADKPPAGEHSVRGELPKASL